MFKKGSGVIQATCIFVLACGFGLRVVESRTQDLQTVNIRVEDYPHAFQNKEPVKIVGLRSKSNHFDVEAGFERSRLIVSRHLRNLPRPAPHREGPRPASRGAE
jgi:hypothetical protein